MLIEPKVRLLRLLWLISNRRTGTSTGKFSISTSLLRCNPFFSYLFIGVTPSARNITFLILIIFSSSPIVLPLLINILSFLPSVLTLNSIVFASLPLILLVLIRSLGILIALRRSTTRIVVLAFIFTILTANILRILNLVQNLNFILSKFSISKGFGKSAIKLSSYITLKALITSHCLTKPSHLPTSQII